MASRTLAQFRTIVASKVGLDNSTSGDQTLIDMWVNEGYEDILLQTHCKVLGCTMTLTSGTNDYTLDTDILSILKIYNSASSINYYMERVTLGDIVDMRRAGNSGAVPPARYYAVAGSNLLTVYPTPGSGETLTVYYVPRPTALSASSDVPSDVPAEFHKAIEFYALREAADYDDDQSSYIGRYYDQQYVAWIQRIKKNVLQMGGSRLPRAVLNRTRRLSSVPHDPSQDIGV